MHTNTDATLNTIEHELAGNIPFGDVGYLNGCTWKRYADRLSMLKEHLPQANDTLAALHDASPESKYAVLGDPVVRRSINQAIVHYKMGHHEGPLEDHLVSIIQIAGQQLRNRAAVPPLHIGSAEARLGDSADDAWIWSDKAEENVSRKYFRELFRLHLVPDGLTLKPATDEIIEKLRAGRALLAMLLPELSKSALNHTHLVAIGSHRGGFISVTNPHIPGAIFLSESAIRNPWEAADNLLHESLHAKFLDIEHTHTLMAPGFQPHDCCVRPPWRRPQSTESYLWPLTRIFTVTHVYIAIALLYKKMEARTPELESMYGLPEEANFVAKVRQSLDRAEYLAHQLIANQKHLGPAGHVFAQWLSHLINLLDPSPRPAGAYLHHLADLYQREANVLASRIAKLTPEKLRSSIKSAKVEVPAASLAEVLQQMMKNEIVAVQQLAEQAGQKVPWTQIINNSLLAQLSDSPASAAANVWAVRALLCQTLLEIPPTRFTSLNEPAVLEDLLFNSSRHIETALNVANA
jgi:hypothetical protein